MSLKTLSKKIASYTPSLAAILFATASCFAWSIEKGYDMPDFPVIAMDGKNGDFSDHTNKSGLTYVEFWATWCGTCRQSFPFLNDLKNKYGDQGLDVIAINMDVADEVQDKETGKTIKDIIGVKAAINEFMADVPADVTVVYGDATVTAAATQVTSVPVAALLDKTGKVISIHRGFKKKEVPAIEKEIADLLKSHKAAVAKH